MVCMRSGLLIPMCTFVCELHNEVNTLQSIHRQYTFVQMKFYKIKHRHAMHARVISWVGGLIETF